MNITENKTNNKEINMPTSHKRERVTARVPAYVYEMISQAAELAGSTLNQFLVQSALEKAQTIIEKEQVITLGVRSANTFFDAIESPPTPNEKLKTAMKKYKESFSNAENRTTE